MTRGKNDGFSPIELLIVVAIIQIIGLLSYKLAARGYSSAAGELGYHDQKTRKYIFADAGGHDASPKPIILTQRS